MNIPGTAVAAGFLQNNWQWILGFGTVGFFGWLVYDKFFSNDNIQLKNNPNQPASALSSFEARKIADTLFNAMDGDGTDEDLIFNSLNGLTYNDFVRVSNAFGVRTYYGGLFQAEDLGLYEWLREELNTNDLQKINAIAPGLITANVKPKPGDDVLATTTVKVYAAEKNNGSWQKSTAYETYGKLETIGEVLLYVNVGGKEYAVIDKPWSTQELMVDATKIALA